MQELEDLLVIIEIIIMIIYTIFKTVDLALDVIKKHTSIKEDSKKYFIHKI